MIVLPPLYEKRRKETKLKTANKKEKEKQETKKEKIRVLANLQSRSRAVVIFILFPFFSLPRKGSKKVKKLKKKIPEQKR